MEVLVKFLRLIDHGCRRWGGIDTSGCLLGIVPYNGVFLDEAACLK